MTSRARTGVVPGCGAAPSTRGAKSATLNQITALFAGLRTREVEGQRQQLEKWQKQERLNVLFAQVGAINHAHHVANAHNTTELQRTVDALQSKVDEVSAEGAGLRELCGRHAEALQELRDRLDTQGASLAQQGAALRRFVALRLRREALLDLAIALGACWVASTPPVKAATEAAAGIAVPIAVALCPRRLLALVSGGGGRGGGGGAAAWRRRRFARLLQLGALLVAHARMRRFACRAGVLGSGGTAAQTWRAYAHAAVSGSPAVVALVERVAAVFGMRGGAAAEEDPAAAVPAAEVSAAQRDDGGGGAGQRAAAADAADAAIVVVATAAVDEAAQTHGQQLQQGNAGR
jgi:hypothetical protein